MPSVKVLLFATFREKYGVKETSLEFDGTFDGFLNALGDKISPRLVEDIYDEASKQIKNTLILMINGRNVKDMREEIKFQDKDVVAIFPPVAGG
ncbi:MAG: MoaD/ThiS family protein [Nitrososphaeria archaeon]